MSPEELIAELRQPCSWCSPCASCQQLMGHAAAALSAATSRIKSFRARLLAGEWCRPADHAQGVCECRAMAAALDAAVEKTDA